MKRSVCVAVILVLFGGAGAAGLKGEVYGPGRVIGGNVELNGSGEWISESFNVSEYKRVSVNVRNMEGTAVLTYNELDESGVVRFRDEMNISGSGIHHYFIPRRSIHRQGRVMLRMSDGFIRVAEVWEEPDNSLQRQESRRQSYVLGAALLVGLIGGWGVWMYA